MYAFILEQKMMDGCKICTFNLPSAAIMSLR